MNKSIGGWLKGYLHRQAREQVLNRMVEAQEEARRILDQASKETDLACQEIRERAERKIARECRRALAQARLKAKQTLIRQREALIERVWREAETSLRNLDPVERSTIIKRLIYDAAEQLDGGLLEVQVNEQDRGLLDEATWQEIERQMQSRYSSVQLQVSERPAPIWGGVIVRRLDLNQMVDNSFDQRLSLCKKTLRDTVYQLMISDGTPSC